MTYTIKSKLLGEALTFFIPREGGYVYLERGARHGTLGDQICDGGDFRGATLSATPETLRDVAQRWYRQRIGWMKREGLL